VRPLVDFPRDGNADGLAAEQREKAADQVVSVVGHAQRRAGSCGARWAVMSDRAQQAARQELTRPAHTEIQRAKNPGGTGSA